MALVPFFYEKENLRKEINNKGKLELDGGSTPLPPSEKSEKSPNFELRGYFMTSLPPQTQTCLKQEEKHNLVKLPDETS
jgi:hypothetical protein